MRHGDAAEAARDSERPLTTGGREASAASARGLMALGASPPRILHSPYVRAAQTAAIVAEVMGVSAEVDARLVPHGDADDVATFLMEQRQGVMLVAHMPILPEILHRLTGAGCAMTTAGVAHVVVVGGHASLMGLYAASALIRMHPTRA
jgi:phosphohistidine phosphatase